MGHSRTQFIETFSQAKFTAEVRTSLRRKFQGHRSTLLCALWFMVWGIFSWLYSKGLLGFFLYREGLFQDKLLCSCAWLFFLWSWLLQLLYMVLLHCLWFKYMLNWNKLHVHELIIKIQYGIREEFLKEPLHKLSNTFSSQSSPSFCNCKNGPLHFSIFSTFPLNVGPKLLHIFVRPSSTNLLQLSDSNLEKFWFLALGLLGFL